MVQVWKGPASLPTAAAGLSVLSYNVLLPNSVDGWWTYKMYFPPLVSAEEKRLASWEYRRDLIQERLRTVDASIVCFQEVAPASFEEDFAFMADLGYDGKELFKKNRFRPATFWKTAACELVAAPVHKDRTLLTAFRPTAAAPDPEARIWYVLNCHLQAGPAAPRRVRQIHEGIRSVLTLARKLKEKEPERNIPLIVCGDFNGGTECGAVRYLEDGKVDSSFLEDGEPVTSSPKELPLAEAMVDVMGVPTDRQPAPPTMVVSELISLLVQPTESVSGHGGLSTAWETPTYTNDMVERLRRIHTSLATQTLADTDEPVMGLAAVEAWLVTINGQVGRGDEFREAARQMGWKESSSSEAASKEEKERIELPPDGRLTFEGFHAVYLKELRAGKFWGIAHDMAVLGEALPITELYSARLDRMYASAAARTTDVMDFTATQSCPNHAEPSDHLPIAASFCLKAA